MRIAVGEMLGTRASAGEDAPGRSSRIALIGLRGAGKSTLGRLLAEDLDFPFVELSREIEKLAGFSTAEILGLYGQNAYRRYERRALEEAIRNYPEAVIATAGGMVSDLMSFNLLLQRCTTVWLRAAPEDHMGRVMEQGDMRPMAASAEAMEDLKSHSRQPVGLLFESRTSARHQRPAPFGDVPDPTRRGAAAPSGCLPDGASMVSFACENAKDAS